MRHGSRKWTMRSWTKRRMLRNGERLREATFQSWQHRNLPTDGKQRTQRIPIYICLQVTAGDLNPLLYSHRLLSAHSTKSSHHAQNGFSRCSQGLCVALQGSQQDRRGVRKARHREHQPCLGEARQETRGHQIFHCEYPELHRRTFTHGPSCRAPLTCRWLVMLLTSRRSMASDLLSQQCF